MKHLLIPIVIAAALCSCCREEGTVRDVIPAPQSIETSEGSFLHKPWTKIACVSDPSMAAESYSLEVTPEGITITSGDEAGSYYARQTLAQAVGVDETELDGKFWRIGCCKVDDAPRFAYRGLMMDVSRHFRSKEFVLKHLDAMAAAKLNVLHMHLTDAAGWRFPVESYPRLNEIGAYRDHEFIFDRWSNCEPDTEGAYGGFYTKDEIREFVDYAAKRHITIIPEIEMPGHSAEVLAAYPELRCTSETRCGDLCPGKDATFELLERVLDEVMELFPSEYIHIGGDEAEKKSWPGCEDCRRRMEEEGLSSLDELQSYMIKRIEDYVESKGHHIIGWDEILEGGLAPSATVMSWRGTEGGKAAIAAGHKAIMTPNEYCYIDTAQDFPENEPLAFGNYLSLNTIYSYNPTEGLADASLLMGLQANLWSELVDTDEYAEYLYWPRGLAIAEVGWTNLERKDLEDFRRRAIIRSKRMSDLGYNVFDLEQELGERAEALEPQDHVARGAKVLMADGTKWASGYPAGGENALTDGLCGGWSYKDGKWQGFLCDVCFMVDLGEPKDISSISILSMQNRIHGIYLPESVEFSLSFDGKEFEQVGVLRPQSSPEDFGTKFFNFSIGGEEPTPVRYIVVNAKRCSKGGFIFFDELLVR